MMVQKFAIKGANAFLNGLSPFSGLFSGLYVLADPIQIKLSLSEKKKKNSNNFYFICGLISDALYLLLLCLFNFLFSKGKADLSRHMWNENADSFHEFKENLNITEEAKKMEEEILADSSSDYAVKILNAGKVFQKSTGAPFAAVNSVSLGIHRGSLFGFLGANGAGKSTMINMIQNRLTLSHGSIEVSGVPVGLTGTGVNPKLLAVCPQFDDHLTEQFTPYQQLKFFAILQGIPS